MSKARTEVDAVVVTYNRLEKLRECLEALGRQTGRLRHIHVVDNNSTDGTREWLVSNSQRLNLVLHLLDYNGGGAGGFNAGIRAATKVGADWVWVMDDDVVPEPDCLQAAMESPFFIQHQAGFRTVGFLSSRVEWTDGSLCVMNIPVARWPWNSTFRDMPSSLPCISCSFVSCFISREAIQKVGLPLKEFFIWHDDTEYTRRISDHYDCFYIDTSVVKHVTPYNLLPTYSEVSMQNLWKFKCDIRNVASVEARVGRKIDKIIALRYVLKNAWIAFRATKSVSTYAVLLYSGMRGIFWNYKKHIEFL
ncbi:glycosyltransferase [Ochrobactrum chromiisoli]|uniref:Glycosyltransferase n=1 Tax=Ochrobactrum chromiisoli TaxID=2993941 RepID=A0ABT3QQF0_9HYPH|nr:glycosyltransferase [Ochrobactrum chromiisoli]MCX2697843.1 glycosyltransferase [Ochrobactrum chromiisoli]